MSVQFSDFNFGFRYGTQYALDRTSKKDGMWNIAIDAGSLSIDIDGQRVYLTDIITGYSELQIRSISNPEPKVYLANDTYNLLVFDRASNAWKRCSEGKVLESERAVKDGEGNNIVNTYQTKSDANMSHQSLKNQITSLQYQLANLNQFSVVLLGEGESLPETGENLIIYFVPQEDDSDPSSNTANKYAEFIWVETEVLSDPEDPNSEIITQGYYEQIGIATLNLDNYYTKSQVYTKTEVDNIVSGIESSPVSLTDYYTKTEVDNSFSDLNTDLTTNYYTKNSVYTKTEVNDSLSGITDNITNNYYTKTEVDNAITAASSGSSTPPDLTNYYTKDEVYNKTQVNDLVGGVESQIPSLSNYYTKTEIDNAFATKTDVENNLVEKSESVSSMQISGNTITLYNSDGEVLGTSSIGEVKCSIDYGEET